MARMLTPIQAFVNLDSLKLQNSHLTDLDIPNSVLHLDISNSNDLKFFLCGNWLSSLDVSGCTALKDLW